MARFFQLYLWMACVVLVIRGAMFMFDGDAVHQMLGLAMVALGVVVAVVAVHRLNARFA